MPVDISLPRECIYRSFVDQPGPCPRCGDELHQSRQTYMIATRRSATLADNFIISSTFGWFCTRCPTVVINAQEVGELLQHTRPDWDVGTEWALIGIVRLDAIPESKRDVPVGEEDNPVPLVQFTFGGRRATQGQPAGLPPPSRRASSRSNKRKRKRR